jgi:glycosyltransferase involved in cell wall biosynthesis
MRILTILTFYHPHWTGLTAIAKRIAEGLAARGHDVTVLTTQYEASLPRAEEIGGVRVVRLPTIGRLSRGMVAPAFPAAAARLIERSDVVQIHTPLMEGPLVAALCHWKRRPLVMTHQGDLVMPPGLANQFVEHVGTGLLVLTARLADGVTTLSGDYARHSAFLRRAAAKVTPIYPPVDIPEPDAAAAAAWRRDLGLEGKKVVGFAGRFVEEKGFDYLLRAIPWLAAGEPNVHLVYAGEHRIAYERFYDRCLSLIEAHRDRITFVGLVRDRRRLADFYALCDVFALPSRTDSFAGVQVEAMLCGTPVVAADIPGAREPVRETGMGLLVAPRDPEALAAGILEVLRDPERYTKPRRDVQAVFDPVPSIDEYERLLASFADRRA